MSRLINFDPLGCRRITLFIFLSVTLIGVGCQRLDPCCELEEGGSTTVQSEQLDLAPTLPKTPDLFTDQSDLNLGLSLIHI